MEAMYEHDLANATEVALDARNRVRAPDGRRSVASETGSSGSSGRAIAGAVRISNAVGAAITNRRLLEPVESHIAMMAGGVLLAIAILAVAFPRGFAYPVAAVLLWLAISLLYRGFRLHTKHDGRHGRRP
jgi:cardiolipin synthase